MKKIVLAAMAALMVATSAMSMSPALDANGFKDFTPFESEAQPIEVVPADISDWDYFWGTTLNPDHTGWNDFWYQCQDPDKNIGDCMGVVATGVVATVLGVSTLAGMVIIAAGTMPAAGTALVWVQPAFGTYATSSL